MRRLNAGGEEDRVDVSLADGLNGNPFSNRKRRLARAEVRARYLVRER